MNAKSDELLAGQENFCLQKQLLVMHKAVNGDAVRVFEGEQHFLSVHPNWIRFPGKYSRPQFERVPASGNLRHVCWPRRKKHAPSQFVVSA